MPQVSQLEVIHTATNQTYMLVVDDRISKRMNYTEFRDQIIKESPNLNNDDIQAALANVYLLNTEVGNKADVDHVHTATNITNFSSSVDTEILSFLTAGTNVTFTYSTVTNRLTISSGVQIALDQRGSFVVGNGLLSSTGTNNIAMGSGALSYNRAGSYNVAVGSAALYSNTTGTDNIAVGRTALYSNTTGTNNVSLGAASLYSNTTGTNNFALGYTSLYSNINGNHNIAMGYASLTSNTRGSFNNALGWNSLYSNSIGSSNFSVGRNSLYANSSGNANIAIGDYSLNTNSTGTNNIAIGDRTMTNNGIGVNNIAIGERGLYSNTTGQNNISLGTTASYANTIGSNNIAIGPSALTANQGSSNIAIGRLAGSGLTSGNNNTIIGSLNGTSALTNTVLIGAGTTERIKVNDSGLFVNGSLVAISTGTYTLPTASISTLGGVKIDGTSITISDGVISSVGGAAMSSRTTASVTSAVLPSGDSGTYNIVGFKGYVLYGIETSDAAWVVLYSSADAQAADGSRSISMDPAPGIGVIAEAITTASSIQYFSPAIFGYSSEPIPTTYIPIKIYNNGVSTATITVTLTLVKMES